MGEEVTMWTLAIVFAVLTASVTSEWSYEDGENGPENWYKFSKDCAGKHQSPVNIEPYFSSPKVNFTFFKRNHVYYTSLPYVISKDNHSVTVTPQFDKGNRASISGGPLIGTYLLDSMHFHWGDKNTHGSEHTLNGKVAAMEMHAVHYNKKYSSVSEATAYPDGLAVFGYLFDVNLLIGHTELMKVTLRLPLFDLTGSNLLTPTDKLDLADILVPFDNNYASYLGSLTTPPCSEAVTWIVNTKVQTIAWNQILAFRSLYTWTPTLRNNFRPIQNLNGRIVVHKEM